jgi:hypothetical protein
MRAWRHLLLSDEYLDFKLAAIHHQSKLITKAMRGLTLPREKGNFLTDKRRFFMLYKVFKAWRVEIQVRQKAAFAMLKRKYKLLALAFYTIKGICQNAACMTLEGKRERL